MEEGFGVAENLLAAIRNGIDAARFYARHEAFAGISSDDHALIELATSVETAAADLDEAMMALLDHILPEQTQSGDIHTN